MSVQAYIGGTLEWADGLAPAAETASGYGALTYTEVENVISIGQVGDSSEDITFNLLKAGRTVHINGVKDMGEVEVSVAYDAANATQIDLVAAKNNSNTVSSFKLTDPSGAIQYFQGTIGSFRHSERNTSNYEGRTFVIRPQSGLTEA